MIFFIQRFKKTGDIWRLSHKLAYIYIYLPFFNDLSLILTAVSTTKATSSPQRKQRTGFVTRGRTVTGRDGRFSSSFFGVRDGRVTSLSRVWPNERLKSLHARHLHWMHFSFWGLLPLHCEGSLKLHCRTLQRTTFYYSFQRLECSWACFSSIYSCQLQVRDHRIM